MNKRKIILTVGMQASGKTFFSKQYVKDHKDTYRVSRDDIRHTTTSYNFTSENEKIVDALYRQQIEYILKNTKFNIILDEMNLNVDRRNNFIVWLKTINPDIEIEIKYFPVTLEEAITRDSLREFKIGEKIIKRTWHRYKNELIEMLENKYKNEIEYNPILPDAVCFDIDGTLSFRNGRNPYDLSKVDQDLPNKIIFEQMNFHFLSGRTIFIFSGREDSCYEQTSNWINKHKPNPDICFYLHMRKEKDSRRDSIVKKELYEEYIRGKYNLIAVYDDRPQVIKECWRELGVFTFDVGKGIEF